jgi:cytidine deaminase
VSLSPAPPSKAAAWPAPSDAERDALIAAARAVRERAYAPYSNFAVGAAVLDEHGRIHAGCNVENAAYPQGWCAEASALAVMVAAGGRAVRAVAVCAVSSGPVSPCGGCRQKLREFGAEDCPVWVVDTQQLRGTFTLGGLLPHGFGAANLQQP